MESKRKERREREGGEAGKREWVGREEKGDSDIEIPVSISGIMALSLNIDSSFPAPCPQSFEPKILV